MKLLWVLSPQHCFIKDDTIIFYQLTKNADKPRFNKTQSVAREARWFLCSGVIAHEPRGVVALGSSSKNIFSSQLSQEKKVGVMILGIKSDISALFYRALVLSCSLVSCATYSFLAAAAALQVFSHAKLNSTFSPLRNA